MRTTSLSTTAITLAFLVLPSLAHAQDRSTSSSETADDSTIIVTGMYERAGAGTKTDTPLIKTPQPVSVITDDIYIEQGALSITDTLRYISGVQSSNYGLDSRVDGQFIRGVTPVQYRDGMRELFGSYNSITADPYNFSSVEVVRGPASVLFGQGSIGGLVNLVSKTPEFEFGGEISARYGSYDRVEGLLDVTGPLTHTIAARLVGRVRNADTQTDYVEDDRVFVAPSLTWRPNERTSLTMLGLYQEDDGGSTAQFLPLNTVIDSNEPGSTFPITQNPNGDLDYGTFVGEPFDRYDGRILQGTALFEHRFSDFAKLRSRARYLDSDVDYYTHYTNSYSNPFYPWVLPDGVTPDPAQRSIGRYGTANVNEIDVFTADNNLQLTFGTGTSITHNLLVGVDYLWNETRQRRGSTYDYIDLYDFQPGSGAVPTLGAESKSSQEQTGIYVQDQMEFWGRVNVVLGARQDWATNKSPGNADEDSNAMTFRAGIIGELAWNIHPFFSYTESFLPVAGTDNSGDRYKPQEGKQYEIGLKWQPDPFTLVSLTGYQIEESNRLVNDPADPTNQIQAGEVKSKGIELEGRRVLPDNFTLLANYSYVEAELEVGDDPVQVGEQLSNVPKHNASVWLAKTFRMDDDISLRLGAGARYKGESFSRGSTGGLVNIVRTTDVTLFDAMAAIDYYDWTFSLNVNNLTNEEYPAACLARGDCFLGAKRNAYLTLTRSF